MMACGIGAPRDVVEEAKDRCLGKTTLALIGSPHHVPRALQARGRDHCGPGLRRGCAIWLHLSAPILWCRKLSMQLDDVPVLVAGGVATGRHIAAALAMGGLVYGSALRGCCPANIRATCIQ